MTRVAVDGGQSGPRLTVVGSGQVRTGPGFTYQGDIVGPLVAAVEQAWAPDRDRAPVVRAVFGLTGLGLSDEPTRARLGTALAATLRAREVVLCADNVTAHAGLLRGTRGVALTVGTGVNCLAVDPATAVHRRVDGWGHLFGDDGSGFAIGRAGLAAVLRAVDGRGPETALTAPAQARFGTAHRMTQGLYTSPTVVDTTAQFAVAVLDAADDGDAVATAIVRAAAAELARTTTSAVATLPGDDPVDVATTGRLLDRDAPPVAAGARHWPGTAPAPSSSRTGAARSTAPASSPPRPTTAQTTAPTGRSCTCTEMESCDDPVPRRRADPRPARQGRTARCTAPT